MEGQAEKEISRLVIVYHPDFSAHGYPALKARVAPAFDELNARGLLDMAGVRVMEAEPAEEELVARVHADYHVRSVHASGYYEVAMLSAGAVVMGAREVAHGRALRVFCFTGSAGHHASHDGFWGFCYLNDVAIAIEDLRRENPGLRFAILDIDPHFGDGTRDILGEDPETLHLNFFSGYPIGNEGGRSNVDFALSHSAGDDEFLSEVDRALALARDFAPDLLFIVFGHDNHRDDYGGFALSDGVYSLFAKKVAASFPQGVCYVLSGGSNPDVARRAIGDVVEVLAQ